MRTLSLNSGTEVVLYTSIKELPIRQSKDFGAYLIQDIGLGSSIGDVDDHLARITTFLQSDKKDEAIEELKNMRFNLFSMLEKWDYKSLSFGCLLKSVNGQEVIDRTVEGLNLLMDRLSDAGLTGEIVEDTIREVKKNLISSGSFISRNSSEMISTISMPFENG